MAEPLRLRVEEPSGAVDAALAESVLEPLTLGAPGDTALAWTAGTTAGTVVGTRTLLDPTPAERAEAEGALTRLVRHAAGALARIAAAGADAEAFAAPPPPDDLAQPSAFVTQLVATMATVRAEQDGWTTADANTPPSAKLRPGVWYQVLDRTGTWAHVRGEDGTECFTDGRTLVPVEPGGPSR